MGAGRWRRVSELLSSRASGGRQKQAKEYSEGMYSTNTEGGPLPLTENVAGANFTGNASQQQLHVTPHNAPKRVQRWGSPSGL